MTRDAAFDDWIAQARAVTVEDVLKQRGLWRPTMTRQIGHPCPRIGCCSGNPKTSDRFSVNVRKNVFFCRATGTGGDAIALVRHIEDCDFLEAVEILAGPQPGRDSRETEEQRNARAKAAEERAKEAAIKAQQAADDEENYRKRERAAAREIWEKALPIGGTLAEAYLRHRGVGAPPGAHLRFAPHAKLWTGFGKTLRLLHEGPALVAGVTGFDGRFFGVEQEWIDLSQPKGRVLVADPQTGELVAAKKARGSKKGGSCMLVRWREPKRLFLGEGNVSTLSVWSALAAARSPLLVEADFRAALSLLNLAGLAEKTIAHPEKKLANANGRLRPLRVPNAVPRAVEDDVPLIAIPQSVTDLYLLGDGDSDPFTTKLAMTRAARRYRRGYPDVRIFIVWPRADKDFNDQWLEELKGAA